MTLRHEADAKHIKYPQGEELEAALAFVRKQREQIPELRLVAKRYDCKEYEMWEHLAAEGLRRAFGQGNWKYFGFLVERSAYFIGEDEYQRAYLENLRHQSRHLDKILEEYRILGPEPQPEEQRPVGEQPKAFISHAGRKRSCDLVCEFLEAMGIDARIVEKRPSRGSGPAAKVELRLQESHFGVVIFTRDVKDSDGRWHPAQSVANECGRLKERFSEKVIYLKERGVQLSPLTGEVTFEEFGRRDMGAAYLHIARELTEMGFLKAQVPE